MVWWSVAFLVSLVPLGLGFVGGLLLGRLSLWVALDQSQYRGPRWAETSTFAELLDIEQA